MAEPPLQPQRATPPPPARRSWTAWLLVGSVCAVSLAVVTALTPELVLVIFLLFMLVGLQYFVWGWWLGNVIRREAEPERQGEES